MLCEYQLTATASYQLEECFLSYLFYLSRVCQERSSFIAGRMKGETQNFLLGWGLQSSCQHSCAGTNPVEMCHLLEESFFPNNMATKTPSYLSLLLGFVKTGPANIEANNLDRQCSPPCFSFPKSSWLMTWRTSLLVRDSNIQISIPTASWELLYSSHSTAAFMCHTDTQSQKSHASNAIL